MSHKLLVIFCFGFLLTIYNCQKKENNKEMINNKIAINENKKLIDGINLEESIFEKKDIDLKKYKYKGVYLEDIYISDLLDNSYRADFFKYLKNRENEDDFKITLFVKLLMIRIQQLNDTNAFYLLAETSKNVELSADGIELLHDYLIELFLENPTFFIKQSTKYNNKEIVNYILLETDEYLLQKEFFDENLGYIVGNEKKLLLNPEFEQEISDKNLSLKIMKLPKSEVIFSPSLYSGWENKTIKFTNIYDLFFSKEFIENLNTSELLYFNLNIRPKLLKYIIYSEKDNINQTATIQDPDGYTNLRKDKTATSEILQKIKSGEHIDVLDNTGDWFLVKTKEGQQGYVHKSRIKSN